jgi:hypothetical protein
MEYLGGRHARGAPVVEDFRKAFGFWIRGSTIFIIITVVC